MTRQNPDETVPATLALMIDPTLQPEVLLQSHLLGELAVIGIRCSV